jgi:undecaprenyl-diphosphatase
MNLLDVIILGLVEGLTEFLPVSSTGHLIIVGHWLGLTSDKAKTFEIFIQLGAVLAVAWEYRRQLFALLVRARHEQQARAFLGKIFVAFLPAAIVGLLVHSLIKKHLFHQTPVALALIVGGVAMYLVEQFAKPKPAADVEAITWSQALGVGLFQTLSLLWPGVSRSASTIIGGLVIGLDRSAATVFSFYLAIPTLGAATLYDLFKSRNDLSSEDLVPFGLGLAVSFVVSLLVVRGLLRYVRHHSFKPFAIYRIAFGVLVLLLPADIIRTK